MPQPNRRQFLVKGAAVAGTAWAAPLLISTPAEAAELHSPPPAGTFQPAEAPPEPAKTEPIGTLPRTGFDAKKTTQVGAGVFAAGYGLKVWGAKLAEETP